MITLTAPQEAALNAAQEVLQELYEQMELGEGTTTSLSLSYYPRWGDSKCYVHIPDPRKPNNSLGEAMGATSFAASMRLALERQASITAEPLKLTTAREALDAVKGIVTEQLGGLDAEALNSTIDALPVA